jgi:hypothetical protein
MPDSPRYNEFMTGGSLLRDRNPLRTWGWGKTPNPYDDSGSAGGPGGPRMAEYRPSDESTSSPRGPGGPRARDYMPDEESTSGGRGPGGPRSDTYRPNPDDVRPGTPRSRLASARDRLMAAAMGVLNR